MLITAAMKGFSIAKRADGCSVDTVRLYDWSLDKVRHFLGEVDVESITTADVRRLLIWLQDEYQPTRFNKSVLPLSLRAREIVYRHVKAFFTWAIAEELCTKNPASGIKWQPGTIAEVQPFSESDIRKLLAACKTVDVSASAHRSGYKYRSPNFERDTAMILTLLDTGLRIGELCRVRFQDVNLDAGTIVVVPWGRGLKSRSRTVMLGQSAKRALWRWTAKRGDHQPDDWLFVNVDGQAVTRYSAEAMLLRLGKRAKVASVHPHRFRHTFAIQFLRNGGDVFSLQRLLGHSDLSMVKRYLAIAQTDVELAHKGASPVDRWRL